MRSSPRYVSAGATTYGDIKIREFPAIIGVVSFLIGEGFSRAGVPLEKGKRTTPMLAAKPDR